MVQGVVDVIVDRVLQGDLYVAFKPLDLQLHGYYSRESVALSTPNRRGRRMSLGLLEVVAESQSESVDWRLKLNGISVTKEFKPHYTARLRDKLVSKFVYDVTSLLNTEDSMGKDWVNLTFRHEGGSPVRLRKAQLIAVYEDPDASTSLKYWTGLLSLSPGDSHFLTSSVVAGEPEIRVSGCMLQHAGKLVLLVNDARYEFEGMHSDGFEEYVVQASSSNGYRIGLVNEGNGSFMVSSVLLYSSSMRKPVLVIEGVEVKQAGDGLRLNVSLRNKGEASPDFTVYTVIHKGNIVATVKALDAVQPGEAVVKELVVPVTPSPGETLSIRVVWGKLSKTWFTTENLTL